MRGFYNLGEGLWRLGRYDEAMAFMEQAEAYAADRDFPAHSYMVEARRLRRLGMQGRWTEAVTGLRSMLDGRGDPGMIGRETLPILARLLVRQGAPDAESVLAESIRHAERADVLEWLVPTGLAAIEHAWLTGRPDAAGRFPELLLERTDAAGDRRAARRAAAQPQAARPCRSRLRRAVLPAMPPGSSATGRPRPTPGSTRATPTSARSSWPSQATSTRPSRGSRCSTGWAPGPPRRRRGCGCASSG